VATIKFRYHDNARKFKSTVTVNEDQVDGKKF